MDKIKVAITDDHTLVREGLERILNGKKQITICGVYSCGQDLLLGLKQQVPDVLLLDIQLPDYTGNQLARIIAKQYKSVRMLALTGLDTLYHITDIMQHGCSGFLTKQTSTNTLIKAIETVHSGEIFLEDNIKEKWISGMTKTEKELSKLGPLTQREKEVLQFIIDGKTNQEIAEIIFLSPRTVESHRFSLMQKLKVKNNLGLIKTALQLGLLQ